MQNLITNLSVLAMCFFLGLPIILSQEIACPSDYADFLAPRLQVGGQGRVIDGGSGNRVRETWGSTGTQVGIMPPNTQFEVLAEPVCDRATSIIWWQIRAEDGLTGWTAEGLLPDEYFVEPIAPPENTATPTLSPTPRPTSTPIPTPTPISRLPLNLPLLASISSENLAELQLIGELSSVGQMQSLLLSPDMMYLFTFHGLSSGESYANVFSFPDLQPILQGMLISSRSNIALPSALFSTDSEFMVTFPSSDDITIYRLGQPDYVYEDVSSRSIRTGIISPESILIVSYSIRVSPTDSQGWLCFIDLKLENSLDEQICSQVAVNELAILADGQSVLAASREALSLYDVHTGEILQTFNYGNGGVVVIPQTEDDNQLPTVLIRREGFILSVNLETGQERTYINGQGLTAREIVLNSDGTQMIVTVPTLHGVRDVLLMDVSSREILLRSSLYALNEQVLFSSDDSLMIIDNEIYNTQTQELVHNFDNSHHVINLSSDGRILFVQDTSPWTYKLYGVIEN